MLAQRSPGAIDTGGFVGQVVGSRLVVADPDLDLVDVELEELGDVVEDGDDDHRQDERPARVDMPRKVPQLQGQIL